MIGARETVGGLSRFVRAIADAELARFIKADFTTDRFNWEVDEDAMARAALFDGKLVMLTNVPEITPADAVARCKALADIERGFRVLKSDIEVAPVHHRLPDRILTRERRALDGVCSLMA